MAPSTPEFVDRFVDDRPRGHVIGSSPSPGVVRRGLDVEDVIAIDHGAMRINPLVRAGWGRAQMSYGPYARRDGLMVAVLALNGHNTSQSERLGEPLRHRLERWLRGHGRRRDVLVRAWEWMRYRRKRYMVRRLRWWWQLAHGSVDEFDENLAVGWFPSEVQSEPNAGGNAFVMHAGLGNNGELWVGSAGQMLPVASLVQDIPMCYVAILRERGAAYYLGSVPGAHAAGTLPLVRPLGIDSFTDEPNVYAGVHQSALGQIGFRVDTRVYGVQVEQIPELSTWYGTAHVADTMLGDGVLDGAAEAGGQWTVVNGKFERTSEGTVASEASSTAMLRQHRRVGVVHCVIEVPETDDGECGLVWRADGDGSCLRFVAGRAGCRALLDRNGSITVLATTAAAALRQGTANSVQVIDDGRAATFAVNGCDVFGGAVEVTALDDGGGVGVCTIGTSAARFRHFEAHPLDVDLGAILTLPRPWYELGNTTVVSHDLGGPAGLDLDGQVTSRRDDGEGSKPWRREFGRGRIVTTASGGAVVDASQLRPNPGSTAYTIGWDDPAFADVSVDITPPGSARGEGERGRGGIVLWQDKQNFLTITHWLDDVYDGASIAIFSHLDGFEEIYDAVWTMIGTKMYYGKTHRLRVVCDGMHVMTFINDEPVLYRALTDLYPDRGALTLNRVGIAANWEWGDDTGSRFENFLAKARRGGA